MKNNLETKREKTWCPGCTNFLVEKALREAISELNLEKKIVLVTEIGCGSKIHNYLKVTSIDGLHGRALPLSFGIYLASKIKNKNIKILAIAGDGGAYNEGLSHFIHACRYNADIKYFVTNNQIFALTTGQATSTTEKGFIEKTHPYGVKENPLNPIALALISGAGFVARANCLNLQHTKEIFKEALKYKGFAFVDILQPCISFHDNRDFIMNNSYIINPLSYEEALKIAFSWNYENKGKIPIGIFYKKPKENFWEKYQKD